MKPAQIFSLMVLSSCLFMACSGKATSGAGKDSTSNTSNTSATDASGDDTYYEYTLSSTGNKISMHGVTKMYVSSKGDMRTEMNLSNSAAGNKSPVPIVLIGHAGKPDESISIDDAKKTYSVNHIDLNDLNTGEKIQSTVTKTGEEKILGFNCVHAKIISKRSLGSFSSSVDTFDIWKSNDVPMPTTVKRLMDQFDLKTGSFLGNPQVAGQLKQMGCEGFMVKLIMKTREVLLTNELTKVDHTTFPGSMFQIPAGYTEDKSGM